MAYISKAMRSWYVQHWFLLASFKCKNNFLTMGCNGSSKTSIWLPDYNTKSFTIAGLSRTFFCIIYIGDHRTLMCRLTSRSSDVDMAKKKKKYKMKYKMSASYSRSDSDHSKRRHVHGQRRSSLNSSRSQKHNNLRVVSLM